jgi:hypothetical protein
MNRKQFLAGLAVLPGSAALAAFNSYPDEQRDLNPLQALDVAFDALGVEILPECNVRKNSGGHSTVETIGGRFPKSNVWVYKTHICYQDNGDIFKEEIGVRVFSGPEHRRNKLDMNNFSQLGIEVSSLLPGAGGNYRSEFTGRYHINSPHGMVFLRLLTEYQKHSSEDWLG